MDRGRDRRYIFCRKYETIYVMELILPPQRYFTNIFFFFLFEVNPDLFRQGTSLL